jgi:signal transduction histidine kinase/ActR/RegA family two-component response regulator
MEAVIFWWPAYRLAGVIKLFTAIVSWTTVFALAPIIPQALALRSPEALQREVDERRRVEAELRAVQRDLEARVSARTEELASANQALRMEVIQRQHAQEQAEFANRMKDEFLATLSHELRTPLTAIVGWAALLKTDQLGPEETARAIETIARNARLQTRLIEDLLDVSRIVSGKLRIESQTVDVKKVIEAAIASTAPLADSKSIKIERSYADDAAFVQGDAARLQQVAWNLLSNAVKFTPVGGAISVQTSRAENNAVIRISDNGEGIASDLLPFVFDRFRQADSSTTRRHGGLGLGLAIVRHLVELHGGQVSIESPGAGRGTTVTVILPNLAAASAVSPTTRLLDEMFAEVPDSAAGDLTGRSALVVDDDPDTLGVLERILTGRGAKVVTASSATQAIETLGAEQPDVLVSDIGMPDGDGYHLIRQVRALENDNRNIPAVALTAFARAQDQACVIQAGFQAYLRKPIDPAELTSAIATLLNADAGPTPAH